MSEPEPQGYGPGVVSSLMHFTKLEKKEPEPPTPKEEEPPPSKPIQSRNPFSKVDPDQMDPSLFEDEKVPVEPGQGVLPPPNPVRDMGLKGGMGGCGGLDLPVGVDGTDDGSHGTASSGRKWAENEDHWKVCAMQKNDEGTELDASKGAGLVMKKLVRAGTGYENPQDKWIAGVKYTARVVGADEPFDARHATEELRFVVQECPLPAGFRMALSTMCRGEVSEATVSSEVAYGAGDADLGVAAGAFVLWTIELCTLQQVDEFYGGMVVKRILTPGDGWECLMDEYEARVTWKGELADGTVFREEESFEFCVATDQILAPWWRMAVSRSMKKGELAELTVKPEAGYGAMGDEALGVPPEATLTLTVKLEDWVKVEDLSVDKDRAALKRTLVDGEGWEHPRRHFEVTVDFSVRKLRETEPCVEKNGYTLVVDGLDDEEKASLSAAVGPRADVAGALSVLLKDTKMGETSTLECAARGPKATGFGGSVGFVITCKLISWTRVVPVRDTDGEVLLREVVTGDKNDHSMPNEGSACRVAFVVRTAGGEEVQREGTAELPYEFVQGEGCCIEAIELAVMEMKAGEKCLLRSPPRWAYGAYPHLQPSLEVERSDVTVELELFSFHKVKEVWEMDPHEKVRSLIMALILTPNPHLRIVGGDVCNKV